MKQQQTLMKFDPANGSEKPYPSNADQWREYHGTVAWLFNPWSGEARNPKDIGSDCFGQLIVPKGEPVYTVGTAREAELSHALELLRDALKDAPNSNIADYIGAVLHQ